MTSQIFTLLKNGFIGTLITFSTCTLFVRITYNMLTEMFY